MARLAQGIAVAKKRKSRGPNRNRARRPRGRDAAVDLLDDAWSVDSGDPLGPMGQYDEFVPTAPDSEREPAASVAEPAGASADSGPPGARDENEKRRRTARAIPWGPFLISPIVNEARGHVGWGAICGKRRDRRNGLYCRKAVGRTALVDDAECSVHLAPQALADGWLR